MVIFQGFCGQLFRNLTIDNGIEKNLFYVGTIRLPRMKNCPLLAEKNLKKKGRSAFDYRLDVDSNIIAVCWFNKKSVNLASYFAGVKPIHSVTRYD